jgi:Zinc finger, C2H2 type
LLVSSHQTSKLAIQFINLIPAPPSRAEDSEPEDNYSSAPSRKSTAEKPRRIRHSRKDGKFECMVCGKGYKHKKAAITHLEQSHLDSDGDEEFAKLRRPPTPKHHAKSNTTETYKCQDCALSFDSYDFFNEHNRTQHGIGDDDEPDNYSEEGEDEQEMDPMEPSPELVYIDADFSNSGGGDEQSNQSMSSKELAQVQEQAGSLKRIQCPDCPRKFKTMGGLKVHQSAEHLNVIYNCEQCPDRQFKTSSYLQYHKKVEHLNMRYTCKVCNDQLRSMQVTSSLHRLKSSRGYNRVISHFQLLWSHSFMHRDFVPFNCEQFTENCTYKTANKGHFNTHLLKIHKIKFEEDVHGYHAETRDEVLSFVR